MAHALESLNFFFKKGTNIISNCGAVKDSIHILLKTQKWFQHYKNKQEKTTCKATFMHYKRHTVTFHRHNCLILSLSVD